MQRQLEALIYQIKMGFFRKIFTKVREREGSLSAMEVFSLEVIHSLNRPTIGQFARFCGISQPNATYKVNSLIRKGYLNRVPSETDRREFLLELTDKYYGYAGTFDETVARLGGRMETELKPDTKAEVEQLIEAITRELAEETRGDEEKGSGDGESDPA